MECQDISLRVELPHEVPLRWKTLRSLYKTLRIVQDTNSLLSVLLQIFKESGHDLFSDQHNNTGNTDWNPFSGLQVFLDEIATDKERKSFFQIVLPLISSLASKLDRCAPAQGLQRSCKQNSFTASLDKDFLASILASVFLCSMPPCADNKTTVDFVKLYENIQRPELKDCAVTKLRHVLLYFERIASNELDLSGEVVFERKVAKRSSIPSIKDWEESAAALCPFIVEHQRSKHQILSADCKEDVCGCFHGKDMIEEDASLEALVSSVFVEELDYNETLLIKDSAGSSHAERLITWIPSTPEQETADALRGLVLRYLNQALICFDGQESKCKFMMKSVNSQQQHDVVEYVKDDLDNNDVLPNETKQSQETNGSKTIPGIDGFCDSLVDQAYNQACEDITSRVESKDSRDVFKNLMMKSLHDVFQKTPEKEKMFSDSIIHSPLLPKCLKHFHSNNDFNSPLVPSTPPSSPVKRGLVKNGRQSPLTSPNPLVDELRLGTKSFADSLAEALMSCVLLSSSIATSIATEALDPLSITSVTMELFQKSPKKITEERQNGRVVVTPSKVPLNAVEHETRLHHIDDSSFCILTNQEDSLNLNELSSNSSSFDSEEDHEERRRSLNELALNLFENFASKLSSSIIQTATRDIVGGISLESIDEESTRDVVEESVENTDEQSGIRNACESYDTAMSTDVVDMHSDRFSDSDSDIDCKDWFDIDKQLEDQLYELDFIDDNEAECSAESKRTLSDMAEDITSNVLRTAASTAATHIESQPLDDEEQEEVGIDYDEDYDVIAGDFLESNQDIEIFASNMSTNIIQAVLEESLSQSSKDIQSTERDEPTTFYDVNSSSEQSVEVVQYANVLTEHLLETSIAIATCGNVHPISTSVWSSCEGSTIDVQMEVVLQWLAASAAACPALTFHSMWDRRLDKLAKVQQTLRENHLRVRDVLGVVLRYIESDRTDGSSDLFEFLLDNLC